MASQFCDGNAGLQCNFAMAMLECDQHSLRIQVRARGLSFAFATAKDGNRPSVQNLDPKVDEPNTVFTR